MNKITKIITFLLFTLSLANLFGCGHEETQEERDRRNVNGQQAQYAKGQPVPVYDWSLERDLVIQLYNIRNERLNTHSVWRSDYGMVEGDCPSMGYGIPYDTSLTNPLTATRVGERGHGETDGLTMSLASIGQAEPNGIFASTNTSATWVMCVGDAGIIEPHYVESKVTVYPGPVTVDYDKNKVTRIGKANVTMQTSRK